MALVEAVCLARGEACGSRRSKTPSHREDRPVGLEVTLRIRSALGGEPLFVYPAELDQTVGDVKETIKRLAGMPLREQRLLVDGQRICSDNNGGSHDHQTLGDVLGAAASVGGEVDVILLRVAPAWAELLEDLQRGYEDLGRLDESARGDRELVLAAISRDGNALYSASEELRSDREVVLAAVRREPLALRFAEAELQDDREVVLEAVHLCGQALQYASVERRRDHEVVLAAMRTSWRAMEHACPELRRDHSFVLAAVTEHGSALLYAAPELKNNREIVLAAVQKSGWALSCASDDLKCDRACVLAAVTSNPAALDFAQVDLRSDPELASIVATASGRSVSAPCGQGPACVVS